MLTIKAYGKDANFEIEIKSSEKAERVLGIIREEYEKQHNFQQLETLGDVIEVPSEVLKATLNDIEL